MRLLFLMMIALSFGACGGEHRNESSGELAVCAVPPPGPLQDMGFQDGDPVQMTVWFRGCLGSSCTGDYAGSCSVSRKGNTLTVHADVSWSETGELVCTRDCRFPTASCWSDRLEAGTYEVKLGNETMPLVIGAGHSERSCIR